MKIAIVQTDIAWNDECTNLDRLSAYIAEAQQSENRLVLLPEMFACGFSSPVGEDAKRIQATSHTFLREQAKKHGLWVAGSLPWVTDAGALLNRALIVSPQGEECIFDKQHLFPLSDEGKLYSGAEPTANAVEIEGVRTRITICYDLRFGYLFWEHAQASDLMVVLANWPAARDVHWRVLLQARAIENQCYVIGVNRLGTGGGIDYCGSSIAFHPNGECIVDCREHSGVFELDVDPDTVRSLREKFPFLADRRE
jgi:predicted amidohydrolase